MANKRTHIGYEIDRRVADRVQLQPVSPVSSTQLEAWDALSARLADNEDRRAEVLALFDGIQFIDQQSTGEKI